MKETERGGYNLYYYIELEKIYRNNLMKQKAKMDFYK